MKTHEKEDLRVRRTREWLMRAFTELLEEKSFHRLTVQDIAELAGINRVTFYGHFADKYALLEHWLREQFQQQVTSTFSTSQVLDAHNLEALILMVMRWFNQLHQRARPEDQQLLPLLFTTMPQELSLLLAAWFKQTPALELPPQITPEVVLSVMSWTIVGAGFEWSDGIRVLSAEKQARQVTALLMAGLHLSESPG